MASRLPMTSGFYNITKLSGRSTGYAKRMNRLSKQIFTEVTRPTSKTCLHTVKRFSELPLDENPSIVNYYDYCRHPETDELISTLRSYGLFRDEHADFVEEMERLREIRGKGSKQFYDRHGNKNKS